MTKNTLWVIMSYVISQSVPIQNTQNVIFNNILIPIIIIIIIIYRHNIAAT